MLDSATAFRLLRRIAAYRAFWLGCPLLLYVWTLGGPFLFDDLPLLLKTERYIRGETPRLDLFRFAATDADWQRMRDRGTYPWWSPEHHRIDFFRPLAEWAFYLDVRLFGRSAFGHRLVSFLWFALAVVCVHRLAAVASGDAVRAGLTALFFGISQTVTQPATFICNRNDLLVIVGSTVAAAAYWRARQDARRRHVPIALIAFALAALSKESGVALAGVLAAHAFFARRRQSKGAPGRTPGLIVGGILLLALAHAGYYLATRASQFDMATAGAGPLATAAKALQNAALYAAVWTIGFPISTLIQAPAAYILAVSAAGLVVALGAARPLWRFSQGDRAAGFFAVWALLFTLPALLVHPESRALAAATVGWAYLLAGLLVPSRKTASRTSVWLRQWLLATNGIVSVCCAVGTVVVANRMENDAMDRMRAYLAAQPVEVSDGDALLIAEASSTFELLCAGDRLEWITGRKDVAVAFLTIPGTGARATREDESTVLLTSDSRRLFDSPTHRLTLGPAWTPEVGHRFHLRDFDVEIARLRPDGSVAALRLRFHEPLDSPRLHFYPPDFARPGNRNGSRAAALRAP